MSLFQSFAERVVADFDDDLAEYGPDEQSARVVAALEKFHQHTPLIPHVERLDLWGFAAAETVFAAPDGRVPGTPRTTDVYFRLVPVARQLGMTEHQADQWARDEYNYGLRDQREMDEERGALGWECLTAWLDLNLCLCFDDETAKPDAGGRRWNFGGEWLISLDRAMSLMLASPWSKEFMANTRSLMSFAMQKSGLEAQMGQAETYVARTGPDGATQWEQNGLTLADAFAKDREGISEEEARRRAFLGPAGALRDDTNPRS